MNNDVTRAVVPLLLMVSGGSDSTALLELAALLAVGEEPQGPAGRKLAVMMADALPQNACFELGVLHVNHLLRGVDSDADEAFVAQRCEELGVPCATHRVDIAALAATSADGMEAVARTERYRLAVQELAALEARSCAKPASGLILTAHTLDDRVETFLMRTLVGTGPGGLGSIPRRRGSIVRPLLDATRQELRDFVAEQHPGLPASALWRDDATNDDGSNFRSQVRTRFVPVMRSLKPGFEASLARTMDLIAEEDVARADAAASIAYRNLAFDGQIATLPAKVLLGIDVPLARRVIRQCLLVVNPDARLESRQIERILEGVLARQPFATEVDSGIRVNGDGVALTMRLVR